MATVKKQKKGKLILPICLVLVAVILVTSIFIVKQKRSGEPVTLNTVSTGSIVESVNATGDVAAGASREYKVGTVATVKEVFVKVGDTVKEGDVLATFDTDDLDAQVKEMQTTYTSSKAAYESSVKSQKESAAKLKKVNAQIPALEKQLKKLQKDALTTTTKASTSKTRTTEPTVTAAMLKADPDSDDTTAPDDSTSTTVDISSILNNGSVQSSLEGIADSMSEMITTLSKLTDDVETLNTLLSVISETVATQIESGNFSKDAIASACGEAIGIAIKQGLIDETKLIVDSGIAVEIVESAVRAVDWAGIVNDVQATNSSQQTAINIQLAALYAEREILTLSADPSIVNSQRAVMNTSKKALEALTESQKTLSAGWTAAFNGVITECNIAPGEQTNLTTTGIRLENMDAMVVNISLGEYDVHKVKTGMQATITTAYGKYKGVVATIAPTATGSSNSSIVDSVGSMAGISGLSSLTDAGAGVKCTVTVDDPDSNIIVGFNADVEIITGEYDGVTCVPIESIVLEKDGTYVYLYDEEESTVTKTPITTSATSNEFYQVTSGLNVGDKIVATPSTGYKEDTFKVKVTEKVTAQSSK